jgi:DNA-binding MarR family transcriptional regulator
VRRSFRALNNVLARGAGDAGLTLQQQAFLLALAAYESKDVLLADIREELEMDQATASELLRKLVRARLVMRASAKDRRAIKVTMTATGWRAFRRSVEGIRREMHRSQHRAELSALGEDLEQYFRFYLNSGERPPHANTPRKRGGQRGNRTPTAKGG